MSGPKWHCVFETKSIVPTSFQTGNLVLQYLNQGTKTGLYANFKIHHLYTFQDVNFEENQSTIYSYFNFSLKNSSFRLPYQRPSSSANCARELFKGSNGSASLVDCTRKKIFGWEMWIFCDWRHKWSSFRVILAHVAWPRALPLGQCVSLKFSLETRLESKSFDPLIDFLAFLVQKLWSKINKLINYLIS